MTASTVHPYPFAEQPSTDTDPALDYRKRARKRLELHADIWRDRPLIRSIYAGYHNMIRASLSHVGGRDLEIGAGHGSFAAAQPGVISCDIVPCPWLDCAADAQHLPIRTDSLANIVMVDVLHHVDHPTRFLAEAVRTLKPGGRIILLEPYAAPVSWLAWRFFHEEDIDMRTNPFGEYFAAGSTSSNKKPPGDPWSANIGIPTLMFWRHLRKLKTRFPDLHVISRKRFDCFLYPLSGGFEKRRLIPMLLVPLARLVEKMLSPLATLLAFRCLVVVEKTYPQRNKTDRLTTDRPPI